MLLVASSFAWSAHQREQMILGVARAEARASFEKDVLYRRWVSMHGGVYVHPTETTPPNPYLSSVPERDVVTTAGKPLTLVNPAYMTRQVHDLARSSYGYRGHITSLKPIRPENAADAWETAALQRFERGEQEVSEEAAIDGQPQLRFMRPMYVEQECLACHEAQGYRIGEVRGGISMMVPLEPLRSESRALLGSALWRHSILLLGGLGLIGLVVSARTRAAKARDQDMRRVAEAEERLALALRGGDLASWDYAVEPDQFAYDERWAAMRGIASSAAPVALHERNAWIHDDDRARVVAQFTAHLEGRAADYEAEYRLGKADGTWLWVLERGRATDRDAAGRALRVCGTALDVTKRKEAEAAVKRSEWRYRVVSEQARDWVVWTADDGRVLFCSAASERLTGYPPSHFQNESDPLGSIVHSGDRALWAEHRCHVVTKEAGDLVIRIVHKDGGTRWIHHVCHAMRDESGETLGVRASNRDVTERMLAERELHRTTSTLKTVADAQQSAILLESLDRRVLFVNHRFCDMFRIPEADAAVGADCRGLAESARGAFTDAERFVPDIEAAIDNGRVLVGHELREHNGTILERDYVPVTEDGVVIAHLWQYRDVTEQHQMRDRVREAEKLEAIGRLAAGVAHDFNNILTIIQGSASVLAQDLAGNQEAAAMASAITSASVRAASLVQQLLAFSGKQMVRPVPLDLNDAVSGVADLLKRTLGEHVSLAVALGSGIPTIRVDPSALDQMIVNLATNARDAMPAGGHLTIATGVFRGPHGERGHGGVRATFATLEVTDTGSGIPEPIRARIFEPFFTTKEVGKGSGLGLPSVLGSARQHGGWVEVDSHPGEGATFRVYFPAAAAEVPGAIALEAAAPSLAAGQVVLLVEDEPVVMELVVHVLRRHGYTVLSAPTGAEALALSEADLARIDLLLTDVVMPGGIGGPELASRLRAKRPELPVVLVTGYSPEALQKELESLSDVYVIYKPFRPFELIGVIDRALRRQKA